MALEPPASDDDGGEECHQRQRPRRAQRLLLHRPVLAWRRFATDHYEEYERRLDGSGGYELRERGFRLKGGEGDVLAYRLGATKAFGFAKAPFSQTRWRFDA